MSDIHVGAKHSTSIFVPILATIGVYPCAYVNLESVPIILSEWTPTNDSSLLSVEIIHEFELLEIEGRPLSTNSSVLKPFQLPRVFYAPLSALTPPSTLSKTSSRTFKSANPVAALSSPSSPLNCPPCSSDLRNEPTACLNGKR